MPLQVHGQQDLCRHDSFDYTQSPRPWRTRNSWQYRTWTSRRPLKTYLKVTNLTHWRKTPRLFIEHARSAYTHTVFAVGHSNNHESILENVLQGRNLVKVVDTNNLCTRQYFGHTGTTSEPGLYRVKLSLDDKSSVKMYSRCEAWHWQLRQVLKAHDDLLSP